MAGPNNFAKEEIVAFEQIVQGFDDELVMSELVDVYNTNQTMMERAGDTIWRPQPYTLAGYPGSDQTANFNEQTQLVVPARIDNQQAVPFYMSPLELRDTLQEERLRKGASQRLASIVNVAVLTAVTQQATIVTKKTSAAAGFVDVANFEAAFNRVGVVGYERHLAFSTQDYNNIAADLANRQNLVARKTIEAYERAYVGMIASFESYKLDYTLRCAAAGGSGITMDTRATANNFYTPQATSTSTSSGQRSNVDNRYQTVTVSSTTSVAAGDAFTIAGVDECHHIAMNANGVGKQDTGSLKTFRVISVVNATQLVISPPIISTQGGSQAEIQYQNTVVATSATAALVFLNTAAGNINVFWQKGAIELLPGRLAIPENAGAMTLRSTTKQGIEVVMQKQFDINTQRTKYRMDVLFGVTVLQPEMCGIGLFSMS